MLFDYKDVDRLYGYFNKTFLVKKDGTLWATGRNDYGELGLPNITRYYQDTFQQISDMTNVKTIVAGPNYTCAIKDDDTFWFIGYAPGSPQSSYNKYIKVDDIGLPVSDIKQIAGRFYHSLIVKNDGTLWATCSNLSGIECDYTNNRWDWYIQVPNMTDVKQVDAGYDHSLLVKNDGSVWVCGCNDTGELGLGDTTDRYSWNQVPNLSDIKKVSCLNHASVALKNDGTLWVCGRNPQGALGFGDRNQRNTFTQVPDISDVIDVSTGRYQIFITKSDGSVWCCGANNLGQLGLGDNSDRLTYTKLGDDIARHYCFCTDHSYIIKNDGYLYCTGGNIQGRLGLGDTNDRNVFCKTNMNNIKSLAAGFNHTVVLTEDGNLYATGTLTISYGPNINYYKMFTQIPNINNIKKIGDTYYTTYILKNDGTLWSTGYNYNGELGLGNTTDISAFTQVPIDDVKDIYVGCYFIFILKNDNTLWSCGDNYYGQLGTGDNNDKTTFVQVATNVKKVYIDIYTEVTYIIKNDNSLWACGYGADGGIGIGNYENKNVFTKIQDIDADDEFITGYYSAYLLKANGDLYGWGWNSYGQLGLSHFDNVCTPTFITNNVKHCYSFNDMSFIIKNDNTVWACGDNDCGQLGIESNEEEINIFTQVVDLNGSEIRNIIPVTNNVFIIKNDNSLWGCGKNNNIIQPSESADKNIKSFVKIDVPYSNIKQYKITYASIHAVTHDGRLYGWGQNDIGQTGKHPIQCANDFDNNALTHVSSINIFAIPENGKIDKDVAILSNYEKISAFVCTDSAEVFFAEDGRMFIRGIDKDGIFGEYHTLESDYPLAVNANIKIKDAMAGDNFIVLTDEDNNLLISGNNELGQLGIGNNINLKQYTKFEMDNIEGIKLTKKIFIIKANGKYYVAGEFHNNVFTEYKF